MPPHPRQILGRARRAAAHRLDERRAEQRKRALERHYGQRLREPLDPDLAVFAAYWNRGFQCNPRAIYEKARELVPGMRGVWVVGRKHVPHFPAGVPHVVAGTEEYFDAIARARVLVNNVNFANHLVKREGSTHVMTHHGTPLKTMGLDLRGAAVASERMDFDALMRRCARWDFSVSSNPLSTEVWERVYPLDYETLETGYPRNDVLAAATPETVKAARDAVGLEDGQVAVLYAPTHREWNDEHVVMLDLEAVAADLPDDHVLLARSHYFYGRGKRAAGERLRDVSAHPSVEELCLAADVLVTDYSSIMFDYAVLDRPIVIHAPDWEVYRDMRGTYFDLPAEPPGVVTRTAPEVARALASGEAAGEPAAALRAAFRARFCAWEDGRAAERVVRRVWLGEAVAPPAGEVRVTS